MRGHDSCRWCVDYSKYSRLMFETAMLPINPNMSNDQRGLIITWINLIVIPLCNPNCRRLDSKYRYTKCRQPRSRHVLSQMLKFLHLLVILLPDLQWDIPLFTFSWSVGQLSTIQSKHGSLQTDYTFTWLFTGGLIKVGLNSWLK